MNTRSKRLKKYVVSAILSNCSFFLLTIVDGIFVGRGVGTDALGAVNLAMPFIMVLGALFTLTMVGGVTVTAIRLGRGDEKGANQAFMHSITSTVVVAVVVMSIGVIFTDQLAVLMGANETYHAMVVDYLFWYSIFIIANALLISLSGFCRNDGSPMLSTVSAVVCTAVNIFLDWLLIFPADMGVAGAAIATGIAQLIASFIVLFPFLRKKGRLRIGSYQVSISLFVKIIKRGLPEMVSRFATPVMTLFMNLVLAAELGNTAINTFSIVSYASSLFYSLFYGAANGLQPLFGQSYGAKDENDLRYYFRRGIVINLVGSAVVFALTLFLGGPICRLFGADDVTYQMTIDALPKFSLNFIFASISIIISAYLYSTKRTKFALALNVCRSLLFNSLIIIILPIIFGSSVVWYTVTVAEALALLTGILLWKRSERNGIAFH